MAPKSTLTTYVEDFDDEDTNLEPADVLKYAVTNYKTERKKKMTKVLRRLRSGKYKTYEAAIEGVLTLSYFNHLRQKYPNYNEAVIAARNAITMEAEDIVVHEMRYGEKSFEAAKFILARRSKEFSSVNQNTDRKPTTNVQVNIGIPRPDAPAVQEIEMKDVIDAEVIDD